MAEAAAAFYAIETAVEGAAVGAFAVSRSNVPLHIRFRKLKVPQSTSDWDAYVSTSVDVVKGKAYVFGGDRSSHSKASMNVVTLPSDIENGEVDYQVVDPEFEAIRPLQPYANDQTIQEVSKGLEDVNLGSQSLVSLQQQFGPRASHASTSIDSDIFILAGRKPQSSSAASTDLFDCDHIYSFSTQTNKWSVIQANIQNSKDGVPVPRIGASCTSTPHPKPESALEVTAGSHGTIFLHGGYDAQHQLLRDMWSFDLSSETWSRWPDLPVPLAEEVAGDGSIACVGKRIWRAGDGFGKMTSIGFEIAEGDTIGLGSGSLSRRTTVRPTQSGWEVLTFGEKAANTALLGEIGATPGKESTQKLNSVPLPRQGAGFLPVQIGAGRSFLLYFMGTDGPGSVLGDVWSFQIEAEENTPAAVKDGVRKTVGMDTGKNQWARCEIIESTKEEGQVFPPRGLAAFAADTWKDLGGGNVILWGGVDTSGQPQHDCWVMTVE